MSGLTYEGKIVISPVIVKKNKLTDFIASVSEAVSGIFLPPAKLRPQKNVTMFTNRKGSRGSFLDRVAYILNVTRKIIEDGMLSENYFKLSDSNGSSKMSGLQKNDTLSK